MSIPNLPAVASELKPRRTVNVCPKCILLELNDCPWQTKRIKIFLLETNVLSKEKNETTSTAASRALAVEEKEQKETDKEKGG